ncbi:MAG: FAD-binding oxidoreductase [Akkermansiaceae bacterium]|nr:FAD-binding oxidoreductase [Akkermansiaceae bacterium]
MIHNYGHGGGGMTLSWGSSHLAVSMAGDLAGRSCAVIGGGVMGLSTARLLQLRGAKVTLYAAAFPPETTSDRSGAQWWPFSVVDPQRRTPEFVAQYIEAANYSFRRFQGLVGAEWGVKWVPNYYLSDDTPHNDWIGGPGGVLRNLQVGFQDFGPGEHVFPANYARRFYTMMIEPQTYLRTLLREVQAAGAQIQVRQFGSREELASLAETVVFNCTGLAAAELFGDMELIPIRGQLTVLLPQAEVNYNLISGPLYMFPRSDGIVLGGTYEKGRTEAIPDLAAKQRILQAHRVVFEKMRENQTKMGSSEQASR